MLHLSHPNDEVAVQVLAFLHTILYHRNTVAQLRLGDLCDRRETIFFQRIQKLLDIVIANLGSPDMMLYLHRYYQHSVSELHSDPYI